LLTGLYPHQAGVGHMMADKGVPGYRGDLNLNCPTIAEALKPAGYMCYAVGKWHVTRHRGPKDPKHNWPRQRGFDRYYGTIHGGGSYFDPSTLTRDNQPISPHADSEYRPKTFYYTDAISDHAVRFVREHARDRGDAPFFLYVAYTAAHWPMHALPEDIAKYKGKYTAGYEAIRQARFDRCAKLGVLDAKQGMSSLPMTWESAKNKPWEAACMEVYAAMVDRMDQGIGKIVAELEKTSRLDNTLILYVQDNGGCAEIVGRQAAKDHPDIARPEKPTLPPLAADDLLPPETLPPQTRDGFPVRMGKNATPGPNDTFVAYGRGWATVSNTPFREYKHWVHEGGIATPLVAHWPRGIAAKGELRKQPGHLIDIVPTCLELAGVTSRGAAAPPLEGKSLVPAFANRPIDRDAIYWEHEGNRAIRVGDMKLAARGWEGKWELYDLSNNRIESRDLAAKQPDLVENLAAKWETWAKRCKVLPRPKDPLRD
jgi:arylsulfatase